MDPTDEARAISSELAGIHAAAYERASTLLDDDLAMCVLRTELTHLAPGLTVLAFGFAASLDR